MLQCHGVILKSRIQVRLGGMSRVPRLREKTEVCDAEFLDKPFLLPYTVLVVSETQKRMNKEQQNKSRPARRHEEQINGGFSHMQNSPEI